MRVHHLNCGTECPLGGKIFDGDSPALGPAKLACHCLLIETEAGLVLVDTGFGLQDIYQRHKRLSEFFILVNRPQVREEDTAARQVERLGFKGEDVRHILLTHLDFDHAGGLSDFPHATVHLMEDEAKAARRRGGPRARARYRPQQWPEAAQWRTYTESGEAWFGFESVRNLEGVPPEILLIPLVGHTRGHCGVAVQTDTGWLLNAGDAYFFRDEMQPDAPRAPIGSSGYERMMEVDRTARLHNQNRLRELVRNHGSQVQVFCSHDHKEFERLSGKPVHAG